MPQQEIWDFFFFLVVFWFLIYLLSRVVHLEKYGLRVELFFIRFDSERFKAFLYKASEKRQTFWKVISNLSIALGAGLMLFALFFLSENLLKFLEPGGGGGSPVVPVLPGLTLQLFWLPYLIVAIVLAAVTHEIAHGIIARVEGINVKSAGAFLAVIFSGAFVEFNDEEMDKTSTTSKMRILSAGSSINLLTGLLVFLVLSLLFVQAPSGIVVIEVLEDGPLERAGFQRWDVIYAVNGTAIRNSRDLNVFMANVTPGEKLILGTSRGNVTVTAVSSSDEPGRAIIGIISPVMLHYPSRLGLGFFLDVQLNIVLNWMFTILVSLAVFSMLPIPFFDGEKFLYYFSQRFTGKAKLIKTFFNAVSLFLILANMALSLESGLSPF